MPHRSSDHPVYLLPTVADTAPSEELAYVALASESDGGRDAIGVVDTAAGSATLGRLVGRVDFPHGGNHLRHVDWSSCGPGCAHSPGRHIERRYLIAPGAGTSRIHIVDTRPDPRSPRLVKVIEAEEITHATGYSAPHAVRCGPDGVSVSALGASGGDGPGGIFTLDPETFEVQSRWEHDRGAQHLAGDFQWLVGHDALITSEWGTPNMLRDGVSAALLRAGGYGRALHVWDVRTRRRQQSIDLGREHQMVAPVRPANNPTRAYGFAGVMLSIADLSGAVFLWYLCRDASGRSGEWKAQKVITIRARRADPARLPPLLRDLGVVPPLVSDVILSADDQWLYVSCWGTGEVRRYDVADPFNPVLTGSVRLGGIVRRTPHPGTPGMPRNGGPQMMDVSRDGRRVYVTNALYAPWDAQFYPDGIRGWMAKLDARADGDMTIDPSFLVEFDPGVRPHQVRLFDRDVTSP
jgi:selenium-binding protein 1